MIHLDCSLRFLVAYDDAGLGLGHRDVAAGGDHHGFDYNDGYYTAAVLRHNYVDCHNVADFHSVESDPRHDALRDALRDTDRTGIRLAAASVSVCKSPRKFGRRR